MKLWNKLFCVPRKASVKYLPIIGLEIHAQIMTRFFNDLLLLKRWQCLVVVLLVLIKL